MIDYTAAAGETNTVVIDRVGPNIRITDAPGIVITPSGGCTAVANVGTCPALEDVRATLGNQNDSATATASLGTIGFILLAGGDGNDVLTSQALGDTQMNGDDDFGGTPGNDILTGGPGEEDMIAGPGNDFADAGAGDDRIINQAGADSEFGGEGSDVLDEGGTANGPDTLSGGPGRDRLDLRSRTDDLAGALDGVAADGAGGCPGGTCEKDNWLPDLEDVSTGQGNDSLTGSPGADRLNTEEGNDTVIGLAGDDTLSSSDGQDTLDGGEGNDFVFGGTDADSENGGPGDDRFNFELFDFAGDTFSGGPGFDTIGDLENESTIADGIQVSLDGNANDGLRSTNVTQAFDNVLPDVEDVIGTSGPDVLAGSARPNELIGLGAADRISGGDGADGLEGGRGGDL